MCIVVMGFVRNFYLPSFIDKIIWVNNDISRKLNLKLIRLHSGLISISQRESHTLIYVCNKPQSINLPNVHNETLLISLITDLKEHCVYSFKGRTSVYWCKRITYLQFIGNSFLCILYKTIVNYVYDEEFTLKNRESLKTQSGNS